MRSQISSAIMASSVGLLSLIALGGTGHAACYSADQMLPAAQVDSFLSDPGSLLRAHPTGGAAMISQVRDLVGTNPATLPAAMGLLGNANAEQRSAIGTGAGQAAVVCIRVDQTFANSIQQAVASSGVSEAILAFASTTSTIQTAAVPGGAGGGGGSPGGLGGSIGGGAGGSGGGSGAAVALGTYSTPNGPFAGFTGFGAGGASILPVSP